MRSDSIREKILANTERGRRTLLLFFYAGHGITERGKTAALLNSNQRDQKFDLEYYINLDIASIRGAYVINLFACGRRMAPSVEEAARGGTEATAPRPIKELGQHITIHSVIQEGSISPETTSLA